MQQPINATLQLSGKTKNMIRKGIAAILCVCFLGCPVAYAAPSKAKIQLVMSAGEHNSISRGETAKSVKGTGKREASVQGNGKLDRDSAAEGLDPCGEQADGCFLPKKPFFEKSKDGRIGQEAP